MCVYVRPCTHVCACVHTCVCVRAYMCVRACIHVCACMHTCVCVRAYMCVRVSHWTSTAHACLRKLRLAIVSGPIYAKQRHDWYDHRLAHMSTKKTTAQALPNGKKLTRLTLYMSFFSKKLHLKTSTLVSRINCKSFMIALLVVNYSRTIFLFQFWKMSVR